MGGHKRKTVKKCEICGVRKRFRKCSSSNIFLARFPLEPNRCRLWVKATGNEDLVYLPLFRLNENKFICGDHFPNDMFNENKSRLKKNAIPMLNLLKSPLSDDILASFPIHGSCKGVLPRRLPSTSGAGVYSDLLQVEESAHESTKSKTVVSCGQNTVSLTNPAQQS